MSRVQFAGEDIDKYKTPEFYQEKNKKYVNFGSDNLYPLYLVDLFNRSAKHNAILTGKQTYVYGAGLKMEGVWDLFANANRFDSLDEIFNKCVLDKLLYGGYALQVIWDRVGESIAEIYHMDFSKIRSNVDNTEFYFSNDWADPKSKVKPYKVFNPEKKQGAQIYYYRDYRPATATYPLPEYIGAIPYVECDVEIANYHRSNLHNEFFFGGILSFNNGEPTEDEKQDLVRRLNRRHKGTDNAGRWIINFSDRVDNAPTVIPIQPNELDKQFNLLNEQVQQEIFVAHKITSPMFFGIRVEGQLGGRAEMIDSFKLFEQNYIRPIQQHFEQLFNYLANKSGSTATFEVMPLEMFKPAFTEQTLIEIATNDEMREMAGLKAFDVVKTEGQKLAEEIGKLSPLVANKVLSSLSQEEIRQMVGLTGDVIVPELDETTPIEMSSQDWESEIRVFAEFGESADLYDEIESRKITFSDDHYEFESHLEFNEKELFATIYEPTTAEKKLLDIVKKNPLISQTDIAKIMDMSRGAVGNMLDKLKREKLLGITEGAWNILTAPPRSSVLDRVTDELSKFNVKYKYTGPRDNKNRDFCRALLNLNKVYTRAEIDKISGIVDRNVWTKRGGWQTVKGTDIHLPFCRHQWSSVLVKKK
jgi:DNA-binding MarR family transcriptional regulator